MISKAADYLFLALATAPFIYYLLVLYCSWRFFRSSKDRLPGNSDFVPPISSLKPILGFWSLGSWMELSSLWDQPLLQPVRTLLDLADTKRLKISPPMIFWLAV